MNNPEPRLDDYYRGSGLPPKPRALAGRHLKLWQNPATRAEEMQRMRASNAEWDFMGRTFLVLALANMACRDPAEAAVGLEMIDAIIDETVRFEKEKGIYFFMMDYARAGQWVARPARSIFIDGPEGSSLWMAAHCLQIIDPAFARDQYDRAHRELAGSFLGFGYAREWPASYVGPSDVDSGPIIPVLDVSVGSSGLALLGASTFGDAAFLKGLIASLNFGGFPQGVSCCGRRRCSSCS